MLGFTRKAAPDARVSEAIAAVSDNYGICRANAVQLEELQDWVRSQYEVMNLKPLRYGGGED